MGAHRLIGAPTALSHPIADLIAGATRARRGQAIPRRRTGMFPREVRVTLATVIVLACLAPVRSTAAQGSGTVRGRVTEAGSQRPVGDVQVTVVGTGFGALTGQNGDYAISNVPSGQ